MSVKNTNLTSQQELKSVLIVDDSATLRGALRAVLGAIGVERIIEAADAIEAIEVLKSGEVTLAITDWKMEPMDGLALVRAVRGGAVGPNADLPMIMLTAYSDARYKAEAIRAGVSFFLPKPFTAASLIEALDAVAASRHSSATPENKTRVDENSTALQA